MSIADFSLKGEVALITGGRRGIGKTLALAFAEAGADVAVCDLVVDDGLLEGTAEEIRKLGRRSLVIQADTRSKPDVEAMVQKAIDEFESYLRLGANVYEQLGFLYYKTGKLEKSLQMFRQVYRRNPDKQYIKKNIEVISSQLYNKR